MNVVLFGATGMVGTGALLECLDDRRVSSVLVIGRHSCGRDHPKLREVLHGDFFDYRAIADDLTLAAAEALLAANPAVMFLYISAAGADRSEQSRLMWARVRGRLENKLLGLPFRAAHVLRPGYIQPMRGARSSV
jgi:nucleoside-diphosphate-sugar epimerase